MNKTKWILVFLLPVQWLSIHLIKNQSLWIEQIYSQKVYPLLFKLQRFFFSALPFSFGDLAYGLAGVYIIWSLVQFFKRKLKARTLIINTIAVASLLSLCFHLLWGLNYYRIPLNEKLNYSFIRQWIVELSENGLSTRSINRKISSLKSYFNFLHSV